MVEKGLCYTSEHVTTPTSDRGTALLDFSLIIPCYNEEESLPAFFEAAVRTLDQPGLSYELIFVDDGSRDRTFKLLETFAQDHENVTVVSFSRNFGKEAALYAGMERACGDCVGLIDADMQQDPQTALDMYRFLIAHEEYDLIAARQERRRESPVLKFFKRTFYRLFNRVGDIDLIADASDFRVMRICVTQAVLDMPEYFRFSKGLFAWVGFKTYAYPYTPNKRYGGKTKWSFFKLFRYAFDGLISFTTSPLRLAAYFGILAFLASGLYLLSVLYEYCVYGIDVPGYPTTVGLIALFGGLQLSVLGIIGEYLGRAYIEGKHRPLYIARNVITPTSKQR
jgi:glycosyltransferase involved in cell wall biosynthesis